MEQSMFVCCWQYLEDRERFMFQDKNNNSKREILYELQDTALIEKKKRSGLQKNMYNILFLF